MKQMKKKYQVRKELLPLPGALQHLEVDKRGYVVPWFVDWINGEPEFRAMDRAKFVRAIKDKLCWVCGGSIGRKYGFGQTYWFVRGADVRGEPGIVGAAQSRRVCPVERAALPVPEPPAYGAP